MPANPGNPPSSTNELHTEDATRTAAGYSRRNVLRILHLSARQLRSWERAGLIPAVSHYNFEHLGQLRTLRDLCATRLSTRQIRASVVAMQRLAGMPNPLIEASAVRRGSRLVFRHAGGLVDPITQQLAFDFDQTGAKSLSFAKAPDPAIELAQISRVQEMFLRAVRIEEEGGNLAEAINLYEGILHLRPQHASAAINLGTIFYNRDNFERAEELYRLATVADPEYALAFFDLGNVLDERRRLDEAIQAYQRAVVLVPEYADAHYNLALAFERKGERRRALQHWLLYVRLDPSGPWSSHARGQARRILSTERLAIVSRRGHRASIAG